MFGIFCHPYLYPIQTTGTAPVTTLQPPPTQAAIYMVGDVSNYLISDVARYQVDDAAMYIRA